MKFSHRHILLVDDDPIALNSLTDQLMAEGYLVMPAANGREVLAFANKLPVDLALLDLDLLAGNSRRTLKRFTHDHPRVPLIITAEHSSRLPLDLGNGTGVMLEKPVRLPTLLRTIEDLLAKSARHRLACRSRRVPGCHRNCTPIGQERSRN